MTQILDLGIPKGLLTTRGDLLTRDASALVRKALGASGTLLRSDGSDPAWTALATILGDILTTRGDTFRRGSGGVERLAKGSAGQILGYDANDLVVIGGRFSCMLEKATNQTVTSGSEDIVTFGASDTEVYDPAGMHSTSANTGRITVPSGGDGVYLLCAFLRYTAGVTATLIAIELLHYNSSDVIIHQWQSDHIGNGNQPNYTAAVVTKAVAGDYFIFRSYQNSGSDKALDGTSPPKTAFSALFQGEQ